MEYETLDRKNFSGCDPSVTLRKKRIYNSFHLACEICMRNILFVLFSCVFLCQHQVWAADFFAQSKNYCRKDWSPEAKIVHGSVLIYQNIYELVRSGKISRETGEEWWREQWEGFEDERFKRNQRYEELIVELREEDRERFRLFKELADKSVDLVLAQIIEERKFTQTDLDPERLKRKLTNTCLSIVREAL